MIVPLSLFALLLVIHELVELDYYPFHVAVFCAVVATIWIVYRAAIHDRREFVLLYFMLGYCIFHFGIVPVYLVAPETIDTIGFGLFLWYQHDDLMVPAYLSALTFLAGALASLLLPTVQVNPLGIFSPVNKLDLARAAFYIMIASILMWCYIVVRSGFASYDIFLGGVHEGRLGAILGATHSTIGIAFVVTLIASERIRAPVIVYVLWAIVAFPLGLRGEVAFPALMGIAFLNSQGRFPLNPWKLSILAVVFLALSSAVAVVRISASDNTLLESVSVVRGIAELGGSIRPSYEVISWLNAGDDLQWGRTYFAPFERALLRLVPFAERIPAELDDRLTNVLIVKRAGPYGFSISAEAFYNYGYLGCLIAGLLSGWIARVAGRATGRRIFFPIALAMVFALFIHIRQSFVSAFGAFVVSLLMLALIWVTAKGGVRWRN